MTNPLVIGLDLGTTTAKAVATDVRGWVAAKGSAECGLLKPEAGAAEQRAEDVEAAGIEAVAAVTRQVDPERIAGLAVGGAMHSLLAVDHEGGAMGDAMIWADQRAVEHARRLREQFDPVELCRATGCPLQPTYHPARLRWWRQRNPDTRPAMFLALRDWLVHALTGRWVTDTALASATGLLNIHDIDWHGPALDAAGIDALQLPPLQPVGEPAGQLTREAADRLGLPSGVPVILAGTDGALANLGAGAIQHGQIVISVGTSGAVRTVTREPRIDDAGRTWCYVMLPDRYLVGGAINNGGLAVQWLRDAAYADLDDAAAYRRIFEDAAAVEPGAAGVTVVPYFAGERSPHWPADAAGMVHGLRLSHDRPHLARATLEGVAFCLADVWHAVHAIAEIDARPRLTGRITTQPF